jgi:hypothetical protein
MVELTVHTCRNAVTSKLEATEMGTSLWCTIEINVGEERHEVTIFFRSRATMIAFLVTIINDAQIAIANFRPVPEVVPAVNDPYSPVYEPAEKLPLHALPGYDLSGTGVS